MDPISIATSAAGLAAFALKASKGIHSCIDEIASSDATLIQLQREVNALQSSLEGIASTFKSDEVVQLCQGQSSATTHPQSIRLLLSVRPLLSDCEKTLDRLATLLESIEGKSNSRHDLLRKPVRALQISLKSKDIDIIRQELRGYSTAMQMTLQMTTICLSIDGSKSTQLLSKDIDEKLSVLATQITRIQQLVLESRSAQSQAEEIPATGTVESNSQINHIEKHIESAQAVFSRGSDYALSLAGTVAGEDTDLDQVRSKFGSVLGMDEHQRQRVVEWLTNNPPVKEIDACDMDCFNARLEIARRKAAGRDYIAAKSKFRECLDQGAILSTLPPPVVRDIKLELCAAYGESEDFRKQQEMLLGMLDPDLPLEQLFDLQYQLAAAYFLDLQLEASRSYAREVMRGRRKLFGPKDLLYLETLDLLSNICVAQGKTSDAEVYRELLPHDYETRPDFIPASKALTTRGTASALRTLRENGFSVDNKEIYFDALNWAACNEKHTALSLLLAKGTDVLGTDVTGQTMLHYASAFSSESIVGKLLTRNANVHARCLEGCTSLHNAARWGRREVARLLLNAGADPSAATRVHGYQPLHLAAAAWPMPAIGTVSDVISLLLDHGADIEAQDHYGTTPLVIAVSSRQRQVMEILLEYGANIEARQKRSWTLHDSYLFLKGLGSWYTEEMKRIISYGIKGWTPLIAAVQLTDPVTVDFLLNYGANIEARADNERGPLETAVLRGSKELTELLLNRGAEVNGASGKRGYPLWLAARDGHVEIVSLLLDRGADTNVKLFDSKPIQIAKENSRTAVVELLRD